MRFSTASTNRSRSSTTATEYWEGPMLKAKDIPITPKTRAMTKTKEIRKPRSPTLVVISRAARVLTRRQEERGLLAPPVSRAALMRSSPLGKVRTRRVRSEERRVGKEARGRGARGHEEGKM